MIQLASSAFVCSYWQHRLDSLTCTNTNTLKTAAVAHAESDTQFQVLVAGIDWCATAQQCDDTVAVPDAVAVLI